MDLTRVSLAVSALIQAYALALLLVCQSASGPSPIPSPVSQCSEESYRVHGLFLPYFKSHGGSAILGCPISSAIIQRGLLVQYLS